MRESINSMKIKKHSNEQAENLVNESARRNKCWRAFFVNGSTANGHTSSWREKSPFTAPTKSILIKEAKHSRSNYLTNITAQG